MIFGLVKIAELFFKISTPLIFEQCFSWCSLNQQPLISFFLIACLQLFIDSQVISGQASRSAIGAARFGSRECTPRGTEQFAWSLRISRTKHVSLSWTLASLGILRCSLGLSHLEACGDKYFSANGIDFGCLFG